MTFGYQKKNYGSSRARSGLGFESLENRVALAADTAVTPLVETGQAEILTAGESAVGSKPRLIVLTDIGGGDPDDEQSMVRLLTYANEFQIEGLIAGSHLVADFGTSPHLIHRIVDQYERVRGNLLTHATGFPTAADLRSKIAAGQPRRSSFGATFDTPGSDLIINAVDSLDARPVNISIWGGSVDLAQALWRVRAERSEAEVSAFVDKLRISWIEQDPSADWIKTNFPELWIVSHSALENPYVDAPFRGMYLGGDETLAKVDWVKQHIKEHQPWGDVYPTVASGGDMKEGDTPTWFYFLPSKLSDPQHPEWGGWGGRFEAQGPLHAPAKDTLGAVTSGRNTVNRWRLEFQNDFEARMDWTTEVFSNANHNPIAVLNTGNRIMATSGQTLDIHATDSYDVDGDTLAFEWFQYREAGSFPGQLEIQGASEGRIRIQVPRVTKPETVHIILKVRDDGGANGNGPDLFDYQRIIVTIEPGARSDINSNGVVDFGDFLIIAANFGHANAAFTNGDVDGDLSVGFSDFLVYSAEKPLISDVTALTPFGEFLVLSTSFGRDAGEAKGDMDNDGFVGFSDFLILSAAF